LAVSHERISWAWAETLKDFDLHVSKGQPLGKPEQGKVGLPCFASTSRSELTFGERKVVGSAQRGTREAFLQHGSIPLTPMHEKLVEALRLTREQRRSYLEALKRHAISLAEIRDLSGRMENETPRLAARLMEALEVKAETGSLTDDEVMMAREFEKTHSDRQKAFFMAADGGATPS
jgi:lipoate-protein ligase A